MSNYFLIAATQDHVAEGVKKGIVQAGHGKIDHVRKMSKGDRFVYYSSRDKFEKGKLLQKFTAAGTITDEEPFQPKTNAGFKPFRRKAEYDKVQESDIRPLLEKLDFIKNKQRWGFYLISGFREISKHDFNIILNSMVG